MAELESTEEMQRALDESVIDAHSSMRARYPHLHIDTTRGGEDDVLMEAAYAEIDHYSITPRTFESRTYDDFAGIYGLIYRDEFAFDSNKVTRVGINSELPEISNILAQDAIELCSLDDDDAATTATKKSEKYTPKDVRSIKLSTIETRLLDVGIEELLSGNKKVVVLDIFERQNGGEKNGYVNTKDEKIKTHSVVLYKNPVQPGAAEEVPEILVIDPSNFLFSSHLSNYQHSSGITIKTCHTGLQIYKSPTNSEGPRHDQYRDCIDIAVKIALGLNSSEYVFDCASKQTMTNAIKECPAILKLSNIAILDKTMETLGSGPARVKQTSDPALLDAFYTARKTIKKNLDALDALDEQNLYREELVTIQHGFTPIIEISAPPQKIIKDFIGQNSRCVELFSKIPATYQEQLLGSINEMGEATDCCWY